MKILVVTQYYYPEPFRINDICESLVKRGHEVSVLTSQPNYPEGKLYEGYENKYKKEKINGVNIFRSKIYTRKKGNLNLFLNYISFPFYSKKVLKKLDKDFNLVFINQLSPIFSAIPGIKFSKHHKINSILYCLDLWPESLVSGGMKEGSLFYNLLGYLSKKIYKKQSIILVTSKIFAEKFNKYGIKTNYLPQYAEEIFHYHHTENKVDNKFHCTFAGNIGEIQSVETIIYAANELKNYEDIIFNIYGTGSNIDHIKSLKYELKLDNVIIHGRKDISMMPDIYSKSDLMLITMKQNELISLTLPGKIQSYLAAGKPIIGAVDGETKLIIEESGSGYVCQAEDFVKMSELILLAKNDKYLGQKGLLGMNYYNKNFDKESFLNKLENIFKEFSNV